VAIPWNPADRGEVEVAINASPPESGQCVRLAKRLNRIGLRTDSETFGAEIKPKGAEPFLGARDPRASRWYHHVVVHTREHAVDSLTGPDGHPGKEYLSQHFRYPQYLDVAIVDPENLEDRMDEP
jgi:hypothetical protein